jgi:hypothetical protein
MQGPKAAALALFLGLSTLAAAPAASGTIAFQISSTVDHGDKVELQLTIKNNGDETAFAVRPTAVFMGASGKAQDSRNIGVDKDERWDILLQDKAPANGSFVVLLKIAYEDSNGYPFEVLSLAPFSNADGKKRRVSGSLQRVLLDDKEWHDATLTVVYPSEHNSDSTVRIALPSTIQGKNLVHKVKAASGRVVRLGFQLRNDTILPGSNVPIYATVESVVNGFAQTDVIRGSISVPVASAASLELPGLAELAALALLIFIALQLVAGKSAWGQAAGRQKDVMDNPVSAILLLALPVGWLLWLYPWQHLLAPTTVAGGDMASLYYPTVLLRDEILSRWRVTGWTAGNYAGFPVFHFYSTAPFVAIAMLGKLLPMQQVFKVFTLLGPTLLPISAFYLFRTMGYGLVGRTAAAASVLPFLVQQGNSMWGGNIPSVLAGEFCHALGLSLSFIFLGTLNRVRDGRLPWTISCALLAVIGLTHTFAFLPCIWFAFYFAWPRKAPAAWLSAVLAPLAVAFLLLCFWGLPLPGRLVFTSEWSMIWNIKHWSEVIAPPLWPATVLALVDIAIIAVSAFLASRAPVGDDRSSGGIFRPPSLRREGLLIHGFAGAVLLYFLVPAIGFPDIRFIPLGQIFVGLLAADGLSRLARAVGHRTILASVIVLSTLAWTQTNVGYIPSWLDWNYSGYEGKPTWHLFNRINKHVKGDINDPRVIFEHSEVHNRFGSSRAFENLPLFSGRSTLEGVFHQASINSPYVFYLQSEASERGSGPFPQYTYNRLNPDLALPHMRMYNVDTIITVSDKARAAYTEHPEFTSTFKEGQYEVFAVGGGNTGYVTVPGFSPVLYDGPEWKRAFYRWFRREELVDIPLVPAELLDEDTANAFVLRTDSIRRIPREPIEKNCTVSSKLEQYAIHFTTDCPGEPHVVKVSYFPPWRATDGSPVMPVSPGFILVYPKGDQVTLEYGSRPIDLLGAGVSLLGLLFLLVATVSTRAREATTGGLLRVFLPLYDAVAGAARPLTVAAIVLAMLLAGYTRVSLTQPDLGYELAQSAYKARDFESAVFHLSDWVSEDKDTFKQATALFQLGVAHTELKQHAAAVQVHERLRFEFPNVNYGPGTLFHLAGNYRALGLRDKSDEAAALLKRDHENTDWMKRLERAQADWNKEGSRSGGE